jgi:hypothetical protein
MQISLLPETLSLGTGDMLPLVHGATTNKASLNTLVSYLLFTQSINRGVSGNMIISGNLVVTGNLNASGATFLGGDAFDVLRVIGQFRQSGSSFLSGNSIITGNGDISGNLSLGTNSGNAHRISGGVIVSGDVNLLNRLTAYGPTLLNGTLTANSDAVIGASNSNNHIVNGSTTFNGVLNTFAGTITTNGPNNFFIGNHSVNGNLIVSGTHNVSGNVVLNVNGSNTTIINGKSLYLSNAYFTQQVFALGNSEFSGNLIVYGNSTFGGPLNVNIFSGDTIILRNHIVTGSQRIGSNLNVTGSIATLGSLIAVGGLSSNGISNSGNSSFGFSPSSTHAFKGGVSIAQNAVISGTLGVSGALTSLGTIRDLTSKYVKFSGVPRNITSAAVSAGELAFSVGAGLNQLFNTGDLICITGATNDVRYNGTFQITRKDSASPSFVFCNTSNPPSVTPAVGTISLDCWVPSGAYADVRSVSRLAVGHYRVAFNNNLISPNFIPNITVSSAENGAAMLYTFDNYPFFSTRRDIQVNDFGLSTFIHGATYTDAPWIWFQAQPI